MKNLQIVTPSQKCIFDCPYCIAKSHSHQNTFQDIYHQNNTLWKNNLREVLKKDITIKNIIITGTNEPMQSKDCIKDIIEIAKKERPDITLEIQTRMYKPDDLLNKLDIVAYSIDNYHLLNKIKVQGKISRYVILLTENFNEKTLHNILEKLPKKVTQLTFKVLQTSHGINKKMDVWIDTHKINSQTIEKLKTDIKNYKGPISIFFDQNCMDSTDRYKIFREDGLLYKDWEDTKGFL